MTGWGVAMADLDDDGRLDLAIVNGHIRHMPEQGGKVANPPLCWKGLAGGRFANVSARAGTYFHTEHEGRGLACGDLDGDGELDLVATNLDAPAVVLWNETLNAGHSASVELVGKSPNTDALGATITASVGTRTMVRAIDGGGGYLGTHAKAAHFGLGNADVIDRLEIRWPSGKVEVREHVPAGRLRCIEANDPRP